MDEGCEGVDGHASHDGRRCAELLAASIEENLDRFREGDWEALDFVGRLAEYDLRLENPAAVTDRELSAVWHFADSFFDAAFHGFRTMNGIPWETATAILEDTADRLKSGRPIEDARVVDYAFSRTGCNPLGWVALALQWLSFGRG